MSFNGVHKRVRRGFTLAELVVVVGLIALLTAGIGRLFAGVSNAVGRGLAVSELNATARSIEEGLRRDIERLNNTNSDETFLAIRAMEIGGDPDRPIYMTLEDKEADLRDGVEPYEAGSRAIVTRLDELAFLARTGGADSFRSQQDNGIFTNSQPTADAARIYYGHGLRPRLDPDVPAGDEDARPLRQFTSDGWFGSPAGEDERPTVASDAIISGRNEFAEDWVLTRQALLLYGARATGVENPLSAETSFGENREYAPYIRDLETLSRFWGNLFSGEAPSEPELFGWAGPVHSIAGDIGGNGIARPDQRLIGHGRVDVCAQTLEGVRRWLEGEAPQWDPSVSSGEGFQAVPLDDTPGSALGVPTDPDIRLDTRYDVFDEAALRTDELAVQRFLWRRSADRSTSPEFNGPTPPMNLLSVGTNGNPLDDLAYNLLGVRSAIAGAMTRPLVELEPAPHTREDSEDLATPEDLDRYAQENDASMDTHAVLAPRCSRFEIAWSDGSYWARDVDLDGDGGVDVRAGEPVWFDISRVDPDEDLDAVGDQRRTYEYLWGRFGVQRPIGESVVRWATIYTDDEVENLDRSDGPLGGHDGLGLNLRPELGYGNAAYFMSTPTFERARISPVDKLLWIKTGADYSESSGFLNPDSVSPYYNPDLTGGAPTIDGWPDSEPAAPSMDMGEYFAIWPFRTPSSTGEWGDAFEKNVWLRVRFTLHDPLRRIERGQTYEVILHTHPRDDHG